MQLWKVRGIVIYQIIIKKESQEIIFRGESLETSLCKRYIKWCFFSRYKIIRIAW